MMKEDSFTPKFLPQKFLTKTLKTDMKVKCETPDTLMSHVSTYTFFIFCFSFLAEGKVQVASQTFSHMKLGEHHKSARNLARHWIDGIDGRWREKVEIKMYTKHARMLEAEWKNDFHSLESYFHVIFFLSQLPLQRGRNKRCWWKIYLWVLRTGKRQRWGKEKFSLNLFNGFLK